MVEMKLFFIDKFGLKRPIPPKEYKPFKWKKKKGSDGNLDLCPVCGNNQSEQGYVSGEDGFVDPKAVEFVEQLRKKVESGEIKDNGYDVFCQKFEDDMIKCHWSRYHTWVCGKCGCIIWEDWIQGYPKTKDGERQRYVPMATYYKPSVEYRRKMLTEQFFKFKQNIMGNQNGN